MAQRMACIALVELDKELDQRSFDSIARAIGQRYTGKDVQKTVEAMLDFGSRYKNLEASLGKGICFILGCDLPES